MSKGKKDQNDSHPKTNGEPVSLRDALAIKFFVDVTYGDDT